MITVSDNDAANELARRLGGGDFQKGASVLNEFCQEHGYTSTHLGREFLASNPTDDNYTSALSKLKTDISNLTKAKKDYLDLVTISTESEIKQATQTKNYTIEYLWSRVGNHATSEGVNLKMEVGSSTLNDSSYKNLNFTATGEFLALVQFIYSLENDANLDFTIDKFDMTANKCTFTVADVKIQQENTTETISSVSSSSDNTAQSETTSNTVTQ